MTSPTAQLLERVLKASGGDRDIDGELWRRFDPEEWTRCCDFRGKKYAGHVHSKAEKTAHQKRSGAAFSPLYTASLDAALALVERVRPGWFWRVGHSTLYAGWAHLNRVHPDNTSPEDEASAQAATPALALIAALLRSMEPQ